MCIVSGKPERISDTRIFAFPTAGPDGKLTHQVTVYANKIYVRKNGKPVAMILPFPSSGGVEVVSVPLASKIFENLESYFKVSAKGGAPLGWTRSADGGLAVQRCGPYRYSVVPGVADFDRVSNVFQLDANVDALLRAEYASGFSFLVCIIDASAAFEPIVYKHRMLNGTTLFLPTKHEHGDGTADWDHEIYAVCNDANFGRGPESSYVEGLPRLPAPLPDMLPTGVRREQVRKVAISKDDAAYGRRKWPNADITLAVHPTAVA